MVLLRRHQVAGEYLAAYVVVDDGVNLAENELQGALALVLPRYMVPSAVTVLEALPVTANGKLDRRALPETQLGRTGVYTAPVTPTEYTLASVFAEILDLDTGAVGAGDSFFVLGGNSLTAMRLLARSNDAFDVQIGVRELFDAPTVTELAAAVDAARRVVRPSAALVPMIRPERIPLSPAQSRMWFLNRFDPESAAYNVATALRMTGALDVAALTAAVRDILERHEPLRTVYPDSADGPYQRILSTDEALDELALDELDDRALADVEDRIRAAVASGFDVTAEIPIELTLLRESSDTHVLVVVVHHISIDGWSIPVLASDLVQAYTARVAGAAPAWTPLPVQYADYALWKRDVLGADDDPHSAAGQQISYWSAELAGTPELLELPADRVRPAAPTFRGRTVETAIDTATYDAVSGLARRAAATPFMVLHAALAVLLARAAGTDDVTLGTPVAGRGEAALDGLVGMFVNTLVLRTPVDTAESFGDLLDRVRATDIAAYAHADVPFEQLVEVISPARSTAHHPLFQVVLSLEGPRSRSIRLPGLEIEALDTDFGIAKFDLQVDVTECVDAHGAADGAKVAFTYACDLFDEPTVEALLRRFVRLVAEAVGDPERPVGDLELLGAEERATLVGPPRAPVAVRLLPDLLADAAIDPSADALVCGDVVVSYGELDARSNRLARKLIGRGVGPETFVAVALSRSVDSVVTLWAVARTGAAFLPVDPTYPPARIALMLDDSDVRIGVTAGSVVDSLPGTVEWLVVDGEDRAGDLARLSPHPVRDCERTTPLRPEHPAYAIYTSGSTGLPKGVVVTHVGLAAFVAEQRDHYGVVPGSRTLHFASPSFDASILELFLAVGGRAAMVVAPVGVYGGEELADLLRDQGVTHAFVTPGALATVDPEGLDGLGVVVVGGDACDDALVHRWAPGRRMFNAYGPTESTVVATHHGPMTGGEPVLIGRPVRGTGVRVLDGRLHPVPVGVAGELYVSGQGLARGYHRRAALTAERFVADPHALDGARMYRTGDLVRWTASGALEYLGRTDFQVKVRGHRIELREVDAVLASDPTVDQAITVGYRGGGADALVSYVLAAPGAAVDTRALVVHARGRLPEYMVPSVVTIVDSIPLTPSGKVDTRALPEPVFPTRKFVQPRTRTESIVAEVFADVLGIVGVGAEDDFFDLGGNSLSATRAVARVNTLRRIRIGVRDLFEATTVEALAARVDDAAREDVRPALTAGPRPAAVPLSLAQQRMWFLNQFDTSSPAYNIPLVVRLTGALDVSALRAAVEDVLERHEALRTFFPQTEDGPHQVIVPAERVGLDLTPVTVAGHQELHGAVAGVVSGGFDVTASVPVRGSLFQVAEGEFVLVLVVHHISADGASMVPLARDVVLAYTDRSRSAAPSWVPLPVQYADFALWRGRVLGDEADPRSIAARQLGYWREQWPARPRYSNCPPIVPVRRWRRITRPAWTSRSIGLSRSGSRRSPPGRGPPVHGPACGARGAAGRLGSTTDVAVGTPSPGAAKPNSTTRRDVRQHSGAACRDRPGAHVRRRAHRGACGRPGGVRARGHPLRTGRRGRRSAAFPSLFAAVPGRPVAQNKGAAVLALRTSPSHSRIRAPTSPRSTSSSPCGPRRPASSGRSRTHGPVRPRHRRPDGRSPGPGLEQAVAIRQPRSAISTCSMPGTVESRSSHPNRFRWQARTMAQILADGTAVDPQAVAVRAGTVVLTYAQLDERSNRLARVLLAAGVGRETFVALSFPRSAMSIVAMWAVVKTGAAFVPVDPAHPSDRIAHMLTDSGASVGLTCAEVAERLPDSARWIVLDAADVEHACAVQSAAAVTDAERAGPIAPTGAAYMIYTSGSTGLPKGVVVEHTGLASFCADARTELAVTRRSRVLRFSSSSFDASVFEMLVGFSAGATLVVVPPSVVGGHELAEVIRDQRVTHILTAPAALSTVEATGLDSLESVIVGGDVCPPELVERFAPGRRFFNSYGPTETTIIITMTEPLTAGERITIGTPLAGAGAAILDTRLRPVPIGVVGELYLSGPGVARGYHQRRALTASRFVATAGGRRMYRTGDLVRRTPDGRLDFVGRADTQVQLRGLRIELGEIEAALAGRPEVAQSVAVLHSDARTGEHLVGYVVPERGASVEPQDLRDALAEFLPGYMVPTRIVVLDRLPVTAGGKLDRRALPVPEFVPTREFRGASDPVEERIAAEFADLLGLTRVSVDDSFFDLGGNSLLATRLVARVNAALGAALGIRELFENPTAAALAVRAESSAGSGAPALGTIERPERIPLSPAQQRMWFLNRFDPTSAAENIPMALRLAGDLDVAALHAAITATIDRHEALRTVYPDSADGPHQVILTAAQVLPELVPTDVAADDVLPTVLALAGSGFDVTAAVPLRVALLRLGERDHVLVLVVHHISADGFSLAPLARDVMVAYAACRQGLAPTWSPLPVQYADYSLWQRAVLGDEHDASSVAARQIGYWVDTLAGLPDRLDLPADRPRPAVQSYRGGTHSFTLDASLHRALLGLGKRQDATLFMVVHAAFAALLARLSGTGDITIGAPVAGRGEQSLDGVVGMFVNTLALRADVRPEAPFADLLEQVRRADLSAFANADVPFERIVEVLAPERSTARHPLFQVALSLQNLGRTTFELPGLGIDVVDAGFEPAKFDLHLTVVDHHDADGEPGEIAASFTYAADLFDEATVVRFAARFDRLLRAVVADRRVAVGDIDLQGEAERRAVLVEWNDTRRQVPATTLPEMFAERVRATPDAVAVIADGQEFGYAEFDGRANALARDLIRRGVGPETKVALAIRRSLDLLVAMYAVAKSGGVYVPVDPDHPVERTTYVLGSAAPTVVLTTSDVAVPVPDTAVRVDVDTLDVSAHGTHPIADGERRGPLHPDNAAYVIYTSGSTGRPKGVTVSHAAITNQLLWKQERFGLDGTDGVLLRTAATFDLSVWEFWWALTAGARLVVARPGGEQDPEYLAALMREHAVTTAHFVPSLLTAFLASVDAGTMPALRRVICIGEALPADLVRRFADVSSAPVFNLYGPTEAAVSVTHHRCGADDAVTVPIGVPEWNTRVYVLDGRLRPVPVGVPGELYLAGAQLARGYAGRPDLTADRFVADPFGDGGTRMYRTGDLVRWQPRASGAVLDYLGRTDFQVKLRGFRSSSGDRGRGHGAPGHRSGGRRGALHQQWRRAPGGVRGAVPGAAPDASDVQAVVAERVPSYMVPTAVVFLAALPLGNTGKLDRRALPVPEFAGASDFRGAGTANEEIVAGVFADLTGTKRIGLDDSFFEVGGNSLLATRATARVNEAFGTDLTVREFFEAPTVAALAARVDGRAGLDRPRLTAVPRTERIPLRLRRNASGRQPAHARRRVEHPVRAAAAWRYRRRGPAGRGSDLVERHEALRTLHPDSEDGPIQVIVPAADAVPDVDVVSVAEAELDTALTAFLWGDFDVTVQLPLRMRLFRVGEDDHVLALVVHHISADGFSVGPLTRDVVVAYAARALGWSRVGIRCRCSTPTTRCGNTRCSATSTMRRAKRIGRWRTGPEHWRIGPTSSICRPTGRVPRRDRTPVRHCRCTSTRPPMRRWSPRRTNAGPVCSWCCRRRSRCPSAGLQTRRT
ncbi:amino acid adenylation domain-containing protein [Rhodococcus hoagii]|nr:amino acid adenylation domain-containing protein [Prescottella equi]